MWHNFPFDQGTFYNAGIVLSILLIFSMGFHWILWMDKFSILQYRVLSRKEVRMVMNIDIFQLFLNYLTEWHHNNIYQNIHQDANYLEATMKENELNEQYKKLDLSDEQRRIITQWIDTIQAQNSAYTAVVFRMGMQFCFSLIIQLADL